MSPFPLVVLALLTLVLPSCVTVPPAPPPPAVVDLSGQWEGGWWSASGGGPVRLSLEQQDGRVRGTVELAGSERHAGAVEGAVEGDRLVLRGAGLPAALELRPRGDDQLHGTLVSPAQLVSLDSTTVVVTRKWPLWWSPLAPRR